MTQKKLTTWLVIKALCMMALGRNIGVETKFTDRIFPAGVLLISTTLISFFLLTLIRAVSWVSGSEEDAEPLRLHIHIEEVRSVETKDGITIESIGFIPRYMSSMPPGCPTIGERASRSYLEYCFGEEASKLSFYPGQTLTILCPQIRRLPGFTIPLITEVRTSTGKPCRLVQSADSPQP